jgi:hypothetical protein
MIFEEGLLVSLRWNGEDHLQRIQKVTAYTQTGETLAHLLNMDGKKRGFYFPERLSRPTTEQIAQRFGVK